MAGVRDLALVDGHLVDTGIWTANVVQAGDVVGAAQLPMSCRGFSQSNTIPIPAI